MYKREVVAEAPEIFRFSEPAGERVINFFGIESENGWTVVDCGLPGTVEGWVKEGVIDKDIDRLIITHADADHFGSGGWLKANYPDIEIICHKADQHLIEDHRRIVKERYDCARTTFGFGYPKETLDILFSICGEDFQVDTLVEGGETLSIGGDDWKIHHLPGHSPGHIGLIRQKDGVFIMGDAFLADGPPNIEGIPSMPPTHESVTTYLQSIDRARTFDVKVVLSGHWLALDKKAFSKFLDTSAEVVTRDIDIVRDIVKEGERSFGEILQQLNQKVGTWPKSEYDHYLYAIHGYLKYLEAKGEIMITAQLKIKRP